MRKKLVKTTNDKVNYYKGETKRLAKLVDNLMKRVSVLEKKVEKLSPKKPKNKRLEILEKYSPDWRKK